MTPGQKQYLFVQSPIGSAIVNGILNGLIGLGITKGLTEFPLWKTPGAAFDLVATAFGVAFGTTLGAVLQIRLDLAKGRISHPELSPGLAAWVGRAPSGLFVRAVVIGIVGTVLFGPLGLGALTLAHGDALARMSFVGLKTGLSAVEGAVLTPFILLATLANVPSAPRAT